MLPVLANVVGIIENIGLIVKFVNEDKNETIA